jgi:hypothetical protein
VTSATRSRNWRDPLDHQPAARRNSQASLRLRGRGDRFGCLDDADGIDGDFTACDTKTLNGFFAAYYATYGQNLTGQGPP